MIEDSFTFTEAPKTPIGRGSFVKLKESFWKSPIEGFEIQPLGLLVVCFVMPMDEYSPQERYLACDASAYKQDPALQSLVQDPSSTEAQIRERLQQKRIVYFQGEDTERVVNVV